MVKNNSMDLETSMPFRPMVKRARAPIVQMQLDNLNSLINRATLSDEGVVPLLLGLYAGIAVGKKVLSMKLWRLSFEVRMYHIECRLIRRGYVVDVIALS